MKKRNYNSWRCSDFPFYHRGMNWMGDFYKDKSTALEILKIRYANGEINKEEYDRMKKDIE